MKIYESQVIYPIELLYKMTYTCSSIKWNIFLLLKGKVFFYGNCMHLTKRQEQILDIIRLNKTVKVDILATKFKVSEQSIRKDLSEICARGLAARIHGGARLINTISNPTYEQKRLESKDEKGEIGRIAATLIPNDSSVMLISGTTTESVARALYNHNNLVVISNNLNIANALFGSKSKALIITGGTIRESDGEVIGENTVDNISKFKADYGIIGAPAFSGDGAILDINERAVSVGKAILKHSKKKIFVCDHSKLFKKAPHVICEISDIDIFITDKKPPEKFMKIADKNNTEIIIANRN